MASFFGSALLGAVLAASGADDECMAAFQAIQDADSSWMMSGPCSIPSNYTLEQLETEACPRECQALYDAFLGNCTPGVDRYFEFEGEEEEDSYWFLYQEAVLYHVEGSKWKSCNYGYEPTACDKAFDDLKVAQIGEDSWSESVPRSVPAVCADTDAYTDDDGVDETPCSSDCKTYIDAVVQACDANPDAMFAPDSLWFEEKNHQRIPWESPKAVQFLDFNSPQMSESCFLYYTDSAAAVNPNFGTRPDDDSTPPFGSEACQSETKSINRFDLDLLLRDLADDNFSESCLDDDISSVCDISFPDAELFDYQVACEKEGGQILTFDISWLCDDEGDYFYNNFPTCVGKSCDGKEVCQVAADQEVQAWNSGCDSCNITTTNCRASMPVSTPTFSLTKEPLEEVTSSSARALGRVLSSSTSSVGAVFLLWALF